MEDRLCWIMIDNNNVHNLLYSNIEQRMDVPAILINSSKNKEEVLKYVDLDKSTNKKLFLNKKGLELLNGR